MRKDGTSRSVQSFKVFVNKHPKLLREIRNNPKLLQMYYEKWSQLGEDHSYWQPYKEHIEMENNKKRDWLSTLMNDIQEVDFEKMQQQMNSMRQFVKMAQIILSDQKDTLSNMKETGSKENLFHVFKD